MDTQPQDGALQIELPEDIAEGVYTNLVMIAHNPEEVVLDFIRVLPGVPRARVKSRVVVTPGHAKRLLAALADNLSKYEAQYGEIGEPHPQPQGMFTIPGGEA
ncbi:MAG TPA: DUF3467 domain-containing protein [Rubricoccaceae bacterium]|jgi:hypothetical protein